jgi:hypothetical protein
VAKRTETSRIGDNIGSLNDTISSAARTILSLEAEKAAVNARITKQKARVKSLGIKLTDFNAALRLFRLEDKDRVESVRNLKVCFDAMKIGHQTELFPDTVAPPVAKPATQKTAAKAAARKGSFKRTVRKTGARKKAAPKRRVPAAAARGNGAART